MTNQISANFHVVKDNLACPCCNAFDYHEPTIKRIQILRDLLDIPFTLDRKGGGFYRCRDYNNSIGGAKKSQHTLGRAMDISTHGWCGNTKYFFVEQAMQLGFSIGIYQSWFHIDFRIGKPIIFYGK